MVTTPLVTQRAANLVNAVTGIATEAEGVYEDLVAQFMLAVIEAHAGDGARFPGRSVDAKIRRAVQMLRARAHENPNLNDVAAEIGLSRSRFFERFKLSVGASPQQYLDWARLAIATDLLVNSTTPLGHLAQELGFSEQTQFNRFFRQHMGLSPGEFRRRAFVP